MNRKIININDIIKILPHRYPFILVDRVTHLKKDHSIIGIKNVTMNEPQFTGHFPDNPIMPGVLIIEALAQLSAILVAQSMVSMDNKEVFFMSIQNAKFRQIVRPGDVLTMYTEIKQNRRAVWKFASNASVDGKVVAESDFTAMVQDKVKES